MAKTRKRLLRASAFDVPMAAFVAGAVGFLAFAMPDPIFTGLVVASGLPDMLAAAQPPLGGTARAGVIGVAVFATFVLVWALLHILSAPRQRRPVAVADDLPRLRRADAHPDAPARRPLVAGAELGEPFESDPPFESEPDWLALDNEAHAAGDAAEADIAFDQPPAAPEAEWEWEGPRFQAESAPVALQTDDDPSIDSLTRRFEAGLVRRRQVRRGRDADASSPMPGFSAAIDPRLQSALDDLQRLANRP